MNERGTLPSTRLTRRPPSFGRTLLSEATAQVKAQLDELLRAETPTRYGEVLTALGQSLGTAVKVRLGASRGPFALVSTPEGADSLVRGMLDALGRERARLVCYWAERHPVEGKEDVANIYQEYFDPRLAEGASTVVVVQSIISSSCIVRTCLEKILLRLAPKRIIIAAPVMLDGAESRLKKDFSPAIGERFEFVAFAVDTMTQGNIVVTGVGGMVEERLGYKPSRRLPKLVNDWHRAVQPR